MLINFILLIIFVSMRGNCASNNEDSNMSCLASKQLHKDCGAYCYDIVRPLLQYAHSVRSMEQQFIEQKDKIHEQQIQLKNMEEQSAQQFKASTKISANNDELLAASRILVARIKELEEREINLKSKERPEAILPTDCRSFNNSNEIHIILVPGIHPFPAPCASQPDSGGWTVVQRRQDGSENFNRQWRDYRLGFGDLHGEFFIGLEKLYRMTASQSHELLIQLENFDNEKRFAMYSNFKIGNENESYKIKSLGEYHGNAQDGMLTHLNMKFSTSDRDNDMSKGNCANRFRSGWWFNNCYDNNLNGRYVTDRNAREFWGINWDKWSYKHLKFTQMMIRRNLN